jgi:hypothetical protein
MKWLGHKPPPLKVFIPESLRETTEGWVLHATRRRRIHEEEARILDRRRYIYGTFSACLAAIAGTSAFAAWKTSNNSTYAAVATIFGIGAALLANALTFLDLGGRAESHRQSAVAYKDLLRDFEEAFGLKGGDSSGIDGETLSKLKYRLCEVDRAAPTVPVKRGSKIEQQDYDFVTKAKELATGVTRPHLANPGVSQTDEESQS